jgi:hypothetical protein
LRQSRLANTDRDNFSEFFVFAQARSESPPAGSLTDETDYFGLADKPAF